MWMEMVLAVDCDTNFLWFLLSMRFPFLLLNKNYAQFHKSRNTSGDWARPFPADASPTSRANEGPASSALPWHMPHRPWAPGRADSAWALCWHRTSRRHRQETPESPQISAKRSYFCETEKV